MKLALKVAARFMRADLSPPLGDPGGPCHVIRRIKDEVSNPSKQESLIQEVMQGDGLTNREVVEVYDLEVESGNKLIRKFDITPHAQYRMDLRGIKVNDVRQTLTEFSKRMDQLEFRKDPMYAQLMQQLRDGSEMDFVNPKTQLVVAFRATKTNQVRVITTYWRGRPDPHMPSNGCAV
jgi:hypothetical protein